MFAAPMLTLALCSPVPPAPHASSAPPAAAQDEGPLSIEEDGVTPEAAEAVRALVGALGEEDPEAFVDRFDTDALFDRAEEVLDARLGPLERAVLRRRVVDAMLGSLHAELRASLGTSTPGVRRERELRGGARSIVLRTRPTRGEGDFYVFLRLVPSDGGFAVGDAMLEEGITWVSEQVALTRAFMRWDREDQRRFDEYGSVLQSAMESIRGGRASAALDELIPLEQTALSFPDPIPAVYRCALMQAALESEFHEIARGSARALLALRPDQPFARFVLARAQLELGETEAARRGWIEYQDQVGPDAVTQGFIGNTYAQEGRIEEAAAAWRAALDGDPDVDDPLFYLGMHLPAADLGEVVERYRARTQPREVLAPLLDAWSNEGACAAVRALSGAVRAESEPDANAWYYEALCDYEVGAYERAARLAREGREHAPAEELEFYDTLWIDAELERRAATSIYADAPDREFAFGLLARRTLWDREDPEALRALLDARAEHAPEGPWLPYYTAQLHAHLGDRMAAEERFAVGLARAEEAGDEERIAEYRAERAWNLLQAGAGAEAYARMPVDAVWFDLVEWVLEAEDGGALERLVALRSEHAPEDPHLGYWRAKADLLNGRRERGVEALLANLDAWLGDEALRWRVEMDLVDTLIGLERYDEALEHAEASTANHGDPYCELRVHVAAGRPQEAVRVFGELVAIGYLPAVLYGSGETGEALREDGVFAPVREKWPPPEQSGGDEAR